MPYAPWTLAAFEILRDGEPHSLDELAARLSTVIPDRKAFDVVEIPRRRVARGAPRQTPREMADVLHSGRRKILREVLTKTIHHPHRLPGLTSYLDEDRKLVFQVVKQRQSA